jgi:hypothetical protein
MEQFQLAASVLYPGETADEFADAGAVDVIHVRKVQNNLGALVVEQSANRFPQQSAPFAESDAAAQVHDSHWTGIAMGRV